MSSGQNLEHVYNFDPYDHGIPGSDRYRGSDLEFFTSDVPLRDYQTGRFVDRSGAPLPDEVEPIIETRDFAVVGSYQRGGLVFDITDPTQTSYVTLVECQQDRNDVAIARLPDPSGEERVVLALTQQSGLPCADGVLGASGGVEVESPEDLAGFIPAYQWGGTAEVDGQTSTLVYAGTGCTPASYVDADVRGKIALVDARVGADGSACGPSYLYAQKMASAEAAGAIGLVQVEESDDGYGSGTALHSGIPGLRIGNSAGSPIRDAVLGGRDVQVTLRASPPPTDLKGWGSGGLAIFDITDPYEWRPMYRLLTGRSGGVHNFVFHPTAPYGYVSPGALPGATSEIPVVDLTDLSDPQVSHEVITEGSAHDIEMNLDGTRAYAASGSNYRIYDTTDPAHPSLISRTPNPGTYAHGVFPSPDGQIMVTNNESLALGGFFASGTGICPGEGLASYSIGGDDEGQPMGPLGYYVPQMVGQSYDFCTSHFGRFAEGTRIMSVGWYSAGTRIVDWTDPASPSELASAVMWNSNAWAAKFYRGPYVYVGDINRGFDVFRWSGDGDAPWVVD